MPYKTALFCAQEILIPRIFLIAVPEVDSCLFPEYNETLHERTVRKNKKVDKD